MSVDVTRYRLDLARLRPDVRAAVVDFAVALAADVVVQVLDEVEDDSWRWAGVDLARRYVRDRAAWLASTPDRPTLLGHRCEHARRGPTTSREAALRREPSWSDPAFERCAVARVRLGEAEWSRRVRASWDPAPPLRGGRDT